MKRWVIELGVAVVALGVGAAVLVALFPYQGDANGDYSWFGNEVPTSSVIPSLIAGGVTAVVVWWALRRVQPSAERRSRGVRCQR